MKTTNYYNTFIEVADDCPAKLAEEPKGRGMDKTVAQLQYEMIINAPYAFDSDEVLFQIHALKKGISTAEQLSLREEFFSKGQACFRASPLTKRYGWGVHFDNEGKMALYGRGSEEYNTMLRNPDLKHLKAVRSKRT